jgi:hypothetical protein
MNTLPSRAVVSSQVRSRGPSPRAAAVTANTIVSELMRSTNELIEVKGMSYRSCGIGPPASLLPLYSR